MVLKVFCLMARKRQIVNTANDAKLLDKPITVEK